MDILNQIEILQPHVFFLLLVLLPVVLWAGLFTFDPMRRRRKVMVIVTRLLLVCAIIASLAQIRYWDEDKEENICVIALLDVSASVPDTAIDKAIPKLEELFQKADNDHGVGLVAFAGSPRVLIPPQFKALPAEEVRKQIRTLRPQTKKDEETPDKPAADDISPDSTHVERALDLAMGLFPGGYSRRLVLFSDGNATAGRAQEKIISARKRGVDLHTVTLSHKEASFDVAVTALTVPSQVDQGVGFDVKVDISAQAAGKVRLRLYRNGFLLAQRELELQAGHNEAVFRQQTEIPGQYVYRATLECEQKQRNLENDTAFAFVRLRSKKKKLLILGELEQEAIHLISALLRSRSVPEFRTPDGAPEQLLDLLDYDGVVLNNLLVQSLPTHKQILVRDWVELFGGGLLVIGLDQHGGYAGTSIEEALPVTCDLDRLPKPSLSVVTVADTSRSIILADQEEARHTDGKLTTKSRPEIIRYTAKQILDSLSERDSFGLINFGTERFTPRWLVRLQKAYDKDRIKKQIDRQLQTKPYVSDPDGLLDLIQRRTRPEVKITTEKLSKDIEEFLRHDARPHLVPGPLATYLRKTLKMREKAVNMALLANEGEELIQPNAFLARSNAYHALIRAVNVLKQMEAVDKRIILLSDGYVEGTLDYKRLAGQLASDGLTLSTIALKHADAHKVFLENVSRWGMGRNYNVSDPEAFAKRFKAELEALGNPRILEQPFRPRKIMDSSYLWGVNISLAPQLFGYVRTAPKLGSQTLLGVPPDYEPLLSVWDYGAGRSAVFTADAQERWAILWIKSWRDGFQQLWESVVHTLCARPRDRVLNPQVDVHGQTVKVEVDFLDSQSRFLNGQTLRARFYYLGESGYLFSRTAVEEVPLHQVAPGRYTCEYTGSDKGLYIARITGSHPRDLSAMGFVISTLAEQTALTENEETLRRWAKTGGGLRDSDLKQWLDFSNKRRRRPTDLSGWIMLLAVILFTLDIILRRWPAFVSVLHKGPRTVNK